MKQNKGCTYVIWVLLSEAVGVLSGWLTREGTRIYSTTMSKPALSPPALVFPIVWTIIFALMGIGAARISLTKPTPDRTKALRVFFAQLAVNFLWSILFFNLQGYGLAFAWMILLWVLILWMIRSFRRVDALAAGLQVPYLLWVTFAAYLNLGVWLLNR